METYNYIHVQTRQQQTDNKKFNILYCFYHKYILSINIKIQISQQRWKNDKKLTQQKSAIIYI